MLNLYLSGNVKTYKRNSHREPYAGPVNRHKAPGQTSGSRQTSGNEINHIKKEKV